MGAELKVGLRHFIVIKEHPCLSVMVDTPAESSTENYLVMEDSMRTLRSFFVTTVLISSVVLATSHSANSGEKRCQKISTNSRSVTVACESTATRPDAPAQTCCQPATASVQPTIELVAYARPASPRRLSPKPDALEINRTASSTSCALFKMGDFGTFSLYYGVQCPDYNPVAIYGNGLGPLPGSCFNPNGACVTIGSAVVSAGGNEKSSTSSSMFQKTVHLAAKLKAGQEPNHPVDALATGAHTLKERTRVGQPTYIKFAQPNGESGFVIVELQRYFVKGTGQKSEELSGTFAIGVEIDSAPESKPAKEIERKHIHVLADHIGRLTIGDVTYDVVTATKLTP